MRESVSCRRGSRLIPLLLAAAVVHGAAGDAQESRQPAARTRRDTTTHAATRPGDSLVVTLAHGLEARSIGPATMGGRVSSIALDPAAPTTFYVGLGMGGVMKTTDNGITFSPVFEHEPVASIGDVAIAPSDPKVVWVATGEGNDRNSESWGTGVYRSTDSGTTWTHAGLPDSRAIARLAVDPTDPQVAYAAVAGDLWMPNAERGLYKTSDGGATWRKVLGATAPYDTRVGAGDVAIDPAHPNTVYAVLYARRRRPWSFTYGPAATDGRDFGGIFKSVDGGASWRKLTNGLPTETGRIGLSIYAKDPQLVYAVVQSDSGGQVAMEATKSKEGGVFRSTDGGEHWTRTSRVDPRPFYFSQIRVDPSDAKRVYLLSMVLLVSDDSGVTWREDLFKKVHPDNHALVIDPTNPRHVLLGNDGGLFQSFNRGRGWDHLEKFAAGEFYRVNVDRSTPFRICGGLQDNTNWVGPSATRTEEGIRNSDWMTLQGGDGSYCAFDATDSSLIYVESQRGDLTRVDLRSGQITKLRPEANEGEPPFRFHWMSPLAVSRFEPGTMYMGGNVVFKLTDRGEHWQEISPDLSTRDLSKMEAGGSGAETYGVVYTLALSPVKAGVLWAGTDDGKVWRTIDDGAHWTDLTGSLPVPARGHWISCIEASHTDVNTAYLVISAFRDGVYAPLVYRTSDGGTSWQSIAANLPSDEPMRLVREDPDNPDVLYAGSEHGLWVSLDRGRSWSAFGELPTVAVSDILIEPTTHSIVVATQGRSLYVIDAARPVAQLTRAILREPVHVFAPEPALEFQPLPGYQKWTGTGHFRSANPEGVPITYYVRETTGAPDTIAIARKGGATVAHLVGTSRPGLNRVWWDLRPTKDVLADYGGGEGDAFVHPGTYEVTITAGSTKSSQSFEVRAVPGLETR